MPSIQEVLTSINTNVDAMQQPLPFTISYYRKNGAIGKMRAVKRFKHLTASGAAPEKSKFTFNLKEKSALLLNKIDGQKPEPRTIKTYKIREFNGVRVWHQ